MYHYFLVLIIILLHLLNINCSIILEIEKGEVQGDFERSSRDNTQYAIFYGIPYAKPPVGKLRFKSPESVDPWEGVYDNRISMKSVCLQNAYFFEHASEDCLYLNVATPAVDNLDIASDRALAVMVWIYGGGWSGGSYDPLIYNPDFFMDKDVVFVSFNYRLGALGFFALENQAFGNQGLRDQTLALEWVQQNIQYFGGDPGKVTIFGESAGAHSVFYQTISPLARGLFSRAIAQSGGNLGPGLGKSPKTQENAFKLGEALANNTVCNNIEDDEDNDKLMECLQDIPGSDILKADTYGKIYANIDTVLGEDSFLPDTPRSILESGDINNVDLLLGVNQDEGLLWILNLLWDPLNDTNYASVRNNWETYGPYMLFDQHAEDVTDEVIDYSYEAAAFYLEGSIENYDHEHLQGIINMLSDSWFWYSVDDWARLAVKNSINTFQYIFSYNAFFNTLFLDGVPNSSEYGVCHADEIFLLFGGALSSIWPSEDNEVSKNMVQWWTDFAKHGFVEYISE